MGCGRKWDAKFGSPREVKQHLHLFVPLCTLSRRTGEKLHDARGGMKKADEVLEGRRSQTDGLQTNVQTNSVKLYACKSEAHCWRSGEMFSTPSSWRPKAARRPPKRESSRFGRMVVVVCGEEGGDGGGGLPFSFKPPTHHRRVCASPLISPFSPPSSLFSAVSHSPKLPAIRGCV